jgi:hypothetical protein
MSEEEYYNIGPSASGFDFYAGPTAAAAYIGITTDLSASSVKIASASSTIDITSTVASSGIKTAFASATSDSSSTVEILSSEILKGLIHLDSSSTVAVSASKTTQASSNIDISSSIACTTTKTTKASTHPNVVASVSSSATRIAKVSSAIGILTVLLTQAGEINFLQSQITISSSIKVNDLTRFSPNFIDTSLIKTFLLLDGKPLTAHNRSFEVSLSPSFIENTNWNNKKNRYYKRASESGRKTFSLSWKYLPNSRAYAVDGKYSRDFIQGIADDSDVHVLKVINQDESGLTPPTETSYNVFVKSYSEKLIRRHIEEEVYFFDCSLTLEQA